MPDTLPEFAHMVRARCMAFVLRAGHAMRRAAHNVRTQNRAHHLPVIAWQNGKVVEQAA